MLSVSRNVFRSESECKGTTFSRNTKQNKNFFYKKTIFFSTKRDSDAFLGNYEEYHVEVFECEENNITKRGVDKRGRKKEKRNVLAKKNCSTGEEKSLYRRTSTAIPANKYWNTGTVGTRYGRTGTGMPVKKHTKYIL